MRRLAAFFASKFRNRFVFFLLRKMKDYAGMRKIVLLYDPNWIRKQVDVKFKDKYIDLRSNGWVLELNINDHIGYRSYVEGRPFEQAVYEVGKRLYLSENDILLDIGANVGTASIPLCSEVGCELIAIEASKGNGHLLAKNIYRNRIKAKLHLFALTNIQDPEYLPLYVRDGNTGANSLLEAWNPSFHDSEPEWVPAITLDELINDESCIRRIKLIKIDVEGSEFSVLSGGSNFLKKNEAPILMEYRLDATKNTWEVICRI